MNQSFGINLTVSHLCFNESDCLNVFYSDIYVDYIRMLVAFPISIAALLLNIFSLIIFLGDGFADRIYKYFRVICINSAFISILDALFYLEQRKYGNIGNNLIILSILAYGYSFLQSISSYFNELLDFSILIERVAKLTLKTKYFQKFSAYSISLFIFLFCSIIFLPSIFYYKVESFYAIMNSNNIYRFNTLVVTNFYLSLSGKIVNYIIFAIKDIFIMCVEIIVNILSLIKLRDHCLKKKKLNIIKSSNSKESKDSSVCKGENKFSKLILIMCVFSMVQHFSSISFSIYTRVTLNFSINVLFFYVFLSTIKNFINFFLFSIFDTNFRKRFKTLSMCTHKILFNWYDSQLDKRSSNMNKSNKIITKSENVMLT